MCRDEFELTEHSDDRFFGTQDSQCLRITVVDSPPSPSSKPVHNCFAIRTKLVANKSPFSAIFGRAATDLLAGDSIQGLRRRDFGDRVAEAGAIELSGHSAHQFTEDVLARALAPDQYMRTPRERLLSLNASSQIAAP